MKYGDHSIKLGTNSLPAPLPTLVMNFLLVSGVSLSLSVCLCSLTFYWHTPYTWPADSDSHSMMLQPDTLIVSVNANV